MERRLRADAACGFGHALEPFIVSAVSPSPPSPSSFCSAGCGRRIDVVGSVGAACRPCRVVLCSVCARCAVVDVEVDANANANVVNADEGQTVDAWVASVVVPHDADADADADDASPPTTATATCAVCYARRVSHRLACGHVLCLPCAATVLSTSRRCPLDRSLQTKPPLPCFF